MGASISCSIFENFSTTLHWFTELQCHNKNILHYLDDFLLGGPAESPLCQIILDTFRDVCKTWGVPLAEDKTVEPVQILTFLGIEFDTLNMELRLPSEKISEIKIMLELFMHVRKFAPAPVINWFIEFGVSSHSLRTGFLSKTYRCNLWCS